MTPGRQIVRFSAWSAVAVAAFCVPSPAAQGPSPVPNAGKTYYLDCQFSGAADPTPTQIQLHSLDEANAILFQAGDRLLLKRETTCKGALNPRGSGRENGAISIGAYGEGALPRIVATNTQEAALSLFNQEYWEVSSLDLAGGSTYGVSIGGDKGVMRHLHLRNLRIHDVRGALKRKESGLLVVCALGKSASFDDVTIDGVHAWNTTQWAGIFVSGAAHVRIRNSMVHDVQGDGIVAFESRDTVIARSVAWHTGMQHQLTIGTPNAIWTWRCTDCFVEENEAFLSDSPGVDGGAFDIDFGNTRNVVRRNFGHDTLGYCVSVFGAFGPTTASVVADNLCINNAMSPRLAQRQGAILLMTWQGGTLEGVDIHGNQIDWQPAGDTPAVQSGSDLHANGITLRENEIQSTGLSFVDPALPYKGAKNRYLVVNGGPNDIDIARRRLARANEVDATIATIQQTNERADKSESARMDSRTWQLIVSAAASDPSHDDPDELRGTIIELESAALQFGHAGLKTILVGRSDLRSLVSDFSLEESGIVFREESSGAKDGISIKLVSPTGKVIDEWTSYPGPIKLGIELRKWLGNPVYSHLPFEDIPAIG
jgi:Right handed beta helix region